MSDGAPRESAVFGGLDSFDDNAVDSDAMDRMLLNLAAASDPPDWQLEPLGSDLLSPSNAPYSSLPLQYIDTTPAAAPTPANTPAHPLSSLHAASNPASTTPALQNASVSVPPAAQQTTSSPSSDNEVQVSLDGRVASAKSPSLPLPGPQQSQQLQSSQLPDASNSSIPSGTPRKRPAPTASSRSPQPHRSPAISGSSAKPRVPTAICSLCGKSISTNGANFRRHEQACRRQRTERVSASRPPTSPALHSAPVNATDQNVMATSRDPAPFSSADPLESLSSAGLNRRDSDLLNVVRRLEASISTLDVSARLCLRDALLSLSNKASNPLVAPTPEQEAMNRAAEYLVLRMLFLSGQQVLHTPPGTAGPPYATDGNVQPSAHGAASRSQTGSRDVALEPGVASNETNDGTVAASTGTGAAIATKQEDSIMEPAMQHIGKSEDKLADGT